MTSATQILVAEFNTGVNCPEVGPLNSPRIELIDVFWGGMQVKKIVSFWEVGFQSLSKTSTLYPLGVEFVPLPVNRLPLPPQPARMRNTDNRIIFPIFIRKIIKRCLGKVNICMIP